MIEQKVWERVTVPIIGGTDPKVLIDKAALADGVRMRFSLRSTFEHRPGSGYVDITLADEFREDLIASGLYESMLERNLRNQVASLCPYARQFLTQDRV